jgi:ammonium transporter, Amt family
VMAMGVTLAMAVVATALIGFGLKATFGLRPTLEIERQGLDVTEHGEEGYIT